MNLHEQTYRIKQMMGLIIEEDNQNWDGLLVGGLDYRKGDYNIDSQVELLKKGLGSNTKIKGFKYNTSTTNILSFLKSNPNISVYLFSAGCSKALDISNSPYVDKNKIYIIEPYGLSKNVKNIVNSAVKNGVPRSNVFYGSGSARGEGIIDGGTKTSGGGHWGALEWVGSQKTTSGTEDKSDVLSTPKSDNKVKTSNKVLYVQKILGIYSDGIYGPQTKRCVQIFQEKNDLDPTGKIDSDTILKVEKVESGEIKHDSPSFCKIRGGRESNKEKKSDKTIELKGEVRDNIIIGDSISPWLSNNISGAGLLSKQPGPSSLWQGGKNVSWLINSLEEFPTTDNIKNVIITIGTNGGFSTSDNIGRLFSLLRSKFPNAKFIVVQGSWGWGGNKGITIDKVKKYYDKFRSEGATVIDPPIGEVEPHGNRPIYKEIGGKVDSLL